jgi:YggT family protein
MINPGMSVSGFVRLVFDLYYFVLLARVILSWIRPRQPNEFLATVGTWVYKLTEPLLQPIRMWLWRRQSGLPVDFSPLILMVALSLAEAIVIRALVGVGL